MIPCIIREFNFAKELYDLGASINLMLLAIYEQLGLEALKPTLIWLLMADHSVKRPIEILMILYIV